MSSDQIAKWLESLKDDDWPPSEFEGQKVVILIENGSATYTWINTNIEDVLSSPPPLELLNRFGEATETWPEISEQLFCAFDNGMFHNDARLVEAIISKNDFEINHWVEHN